MRNYITKTELVNEVICEDILISVQGNGFSENIFMKGVDIADDTFEFESNAIQFDWENAKIYTEDEFYVIEFSNGMEARLCKVFN